MTDGLLPKSSPDSKLGRVSVLVEERPPNRAAVRMHLRQFDGEEVQGTITMARARLEQLLRDAAKVTAARSAIARFVILSERMGLRFFEFQTKDPEKDAIDCVIEIAEILEAP